MAIPKLPNYHHLPMIDRLNKILDSNGAKNNFVFEASENSDLELVDSSIGKKIVKSCLYFSCFCCCPLWSHNDQLARREARDLVFACIRLTYGLAVAQAAFAGIGRDHITARQAVRAIKYANSHNQGMAADLSDKVRTRRVDDLYSAMAEVLDAPTCGTQSMRLVNGGLDASWQHHCIPCRAARWIGNCVNLYDSAKYKEAQKEGVEFLQVVVQQSWMCPEDVKPFFAPHIRNGYITVRDARRILEAEEALFDACRWRRPHFQQSDITNGYGAENMILGY